MKYKPDKDKSSSFTTFYSMFVLYINGIKILLVLFNSKIYSPLIPLQGFLSLRFLYNVRHVLILSYRLYCRMVLF